MDPGQGNFASYGTGLTPQPMQSIQVYNQIHIDLLNVAPHHIKLNPVFLHNINNKKRLVTSMDHGHGGLRYF